MDVVDCAPFDQDGHRYRAEGVWPDGAAPEEPPNVDGATTGYTSRLTVILDEGRPGVSDG